MLQLQGGKIHRSRGLAASEFVLGPMIKTARYRLDTDEGENNLTVCEGVGVGGFLLAGLITSLEKMFPGRLNRKQVYFIVTGAVLSILVKSFIASTDVGSLGVVTHCIDVTIRWRYIGTLIYI